MFFFFALLLRRGLCLLCLLSEEGNSLTLELSEFEHCSVTSLALRLSPESLYHDEQG